ncbi:MAG: ATP-binding protein [Spirochaetota bacterium]
MKLFTKTFFFFMSIIILQSSLTVLFITNFIKKNNIEDAKKELANESMLVYENFNSWKRNIWMSLIHMRDDRVLRRRLENYESLISKSDIISYLHEKLPIYNFDYLVIKSNKYPYLEIIPSDRNIFTLPDLKNLRNYKDHPYIEVNFLGHVLTMTGTARIIALREKIIDIFIIKVLDENFTNLLTAQRRSEACLYINDRLLIGSFREMGHIPQDDLLSINSSYTEIYERELDGKSFNYTIQKLNQVDLDGNRHNLLLITLLSNLPYQKRLISIKTTVLYMTIISALLTAALSLFLSRNISKPIKKLLGAMHRVKNGRYEEESRVVSKTEIGELFRGFNEMVSQLSQDKIKMQNYINEIIMLKDYNEKIIHSIQSGIAIVNQDMIVEKVNSSFLDYFHRKEEEVVGKRIDGIGIELLDLEIVENIQHLIDRSKDYFSKVKRSDGSRVYELKLYPLASNPAMQGDASGCVLTIEDISEKIELENKIFQAEKLASISMLSAGVAHEINNPLSSIMSNVQNLIEEEKKEDKKISLKWIEQETRRIARTVRELLNFASPETRSMEGSDINKIIKRVIELIRYSIKREKDITIETSFDLNIPQAIIKEDELQQIMINLITNSIQAIVKSGRIVVSTCLQSDDHYVQITVEDNGTGIKKEHLPHIFDPFFTTKPNWEGTGLGLSIVYGIVKKYNGNIEVESETGVGTKVIIKLPSFQG